VTPYFYPGIGVRNEIREAARRGVRVRILTVGPLSNLALVRAGGRRIYGELLEAGVEIYEYAPTMFHAKMMLVDGSWSIVGTTNFDHRSFMINDEINLAVRDRGLAARLAGDVAVDLKESRRIRLEDWKARPFSGRILEQLSRILERQQ
jgi:cardiolipin synthase